MLGVISVKSVAPLSIEVGIFTMQGSVQRLNHHVKLKYR